MMIAGAGGRGGGEGERGSGARLLGLDDLPVLELHADGAPVLGEDLGDVRVHLQLAAELLEAAHHGVGDVLRAADGDGVAGAVDEEAVEDVQDVRRHRALGREAAEDAHSVDEVPEERLRHELVYCFVQGVEGER